MTKLTRRKFVKATSIAGIAIAASSTLPYRLAGAQQSHNEYFDLLRDQDFKDLAAVALDAAKAAGAVYADVHFTILREERWQFFSQLKYPTPLPYATIGIGVRSLVNGSWGFAGLDGTVSPDDAANLGSDSAAQAKVAAIGKPEAVKLADIPSVGNGSWVMPVEIDPFTVSYQEKADFLAGMRDYIERQSYDVATGPADRLNLEKEERIFASTEGVFTSQTVYKTSATLTILLGRDWQQELSGFIQADFLSFAGKGWEHIRKAPFQDKAEELIERAILSRRPKPVDVGRYDIVFDAHALAGIVSTSIGAATELDRAMGYEANNAGTSYLNEPSEMLGTFKVGAPLLNVTANRSMPGGAATIKWDEEGVEPSETVLIKDGILNDYQTTRESASWIAERYLNKGKSVMSNGCAGMYTPTTPITQVNPNFVLQPAVKDVSFDDIIKDTKKGLAVFGGDVTTDHQSLNGAGTGFVREIVDGKLGQVIRGAQFLYRAPDFWKGLVAIGGNSTVHMRGFERSRNGGASAHTVSAVPGKITGVAVTDIMRKS